MKEFITALVHSLRTPLSVIQSDLEFIQGAHPEMEADRTIRNVGRVTEVLLRIEVINEAEDLGDVFSILEGMSSWNCIDLSQEKLVASLRMPGSVDLKEGDLIFVNSLGVFYERIVKSCIPEAYLLDQKIDQLGYTPLLEFVLDARGINCTVMFGKN